LNKKIILRIFCIFILFILFFSLSVVSAEDRIGEGWPSAEGWFNWGEFDSSFDPADELGWYPLEDWEYGVCSSSFTSDYFFNNEAGGHSGISSEEVYKTAIAVNSEIRLTNFTDENNNQEYLFEIGWYIQGVDPGDNSNVKYKLLLLPHRDYIKFEDDATEKEFNLVTGESGYFSEYTTKKYESGKLILKINGNTENHEFTIIDLDGE